ncbi:MAG TPA: ferric reductase-like transmembrane domain-containing protein [Candidatus Saccharimonadales bacterium]|jgi:sulfoxide reductase heme-binding subunit YedZ
MKQTLQYWLSGVRLYLALGIGLITLEVWWWATTVFDDQRLAAVRLQEVYGWISVALLAVTLLIGPVTKIIINIPGKQQIREGRRMIGIGAAWFALLHAVIAYVGQFPGSNPLELPKVYQQSLLLGLVGLIILMILAATSMNAVMRALGVWWFRLHRLVYVSALAVLMHAFMIGAHATSVVVLAVLALISALWIGCNVYFLLRDPSQSVWRIIGLCYGTVLLLAVLNYGLTQHLGYNAVIQEHKGHLEQRK